MKINASKSVFAVRQLRYLVYVLNADGISADLERIEALQKAPRPTKAEQLRSFLGFAQYYAKFVPGFSQKAQPLFELLSKDNFRWTSQHDQVYDQVLASLLNSKVLRSFRMGVSSDLVVDASEHAIGAVLEQEQHPVVCVSRTLLSSEKNYSQTQEALAVHWAVKQLHKYLYGSKFRIVTDHKALEYLLHPTSSLSKVTSAMMQRWALHLSAYDYSIVHRPGKDIPQADFLSRHAFGEKGSDPGDTTILLTNPLPITRNHLLEETRLAYGPKPWLKTNFSK